MNKKVNSFIILYNLTYYHHHHHHCHMHYNINTLPLTLRFSLSKNKTFVNPFKSLSLKRNESFFLLFWYSTCNKKTGMCQLQKIILLFPLLSIMNTKIFIWSGQGSSVFGRFFHLHFCAKYLTKLPQIFYLGFSELNLSLFLDLRNTFFLVSVVIVSCASIFLENKWIKYEKKQGFPAESNDWVGVNVVQLLFTDLSA